MDTPVKLLRCVIDGRWTADEMVASIAHIHNLYNFTFFLKAFRYEPPLPQFFPQVQRPKPFSDRDLFKLDDLLIPEARLEVRGLRYGSPGVKDFAGLGEVVGHVKDFILQLLEFSDSRRRRELENQEREIRNRKLELENELLEAEIESWRLSNLAEFFVLAEKIGFPEENVRQFARDAKLRQQMFMRLVAEGKVKGAELRDELSK